eukprot:scpid45153/ scgid34896/ 
MKVAMILLILSCVLFSTGWAHLCLLEPKQRGPLDVSEPGSHTCFRHGEQCGGEAAGAVAAHFTVGQTVFIKWQQNFNHYEVGHPGYMDIAIATSENSTDFTFLAGFGDINWHQQSHQQNYTVPVVMPDIECEHCVIRARYLAHKPGETVFYQCSDVTVRRARPNDEMSTNRQRVPKIGKWREVSDFIEKHNAHLDGKRTVAKANADTSGLYGLTCNAFQNPHSCGFVRIDAETGIVGKIGSEKFGVDAAGPLPSDNNPGDYILDQVVAYAGENLVYYLVHTGTVDDNSQSVIAVRTDSGSALETYPLTVGEPVNAMLMTGSEVVTLQIYRNTIKTDSFDFHWSKVDLQTGVLTKFFQPAKPEDLYINYLWSTYDTKNHIIYYLMGNENAPYDLNARLYAVSLIAGAAEIAPVELNVTRYTMGSIEYDSTSDRLVAISPGLYTEGSPSWHMVEVNPRTGAVSTICQIAPAGLFKGDYTGGIFFGDQSTSTFYVRLRAMTEGPLQAEVFASVTLHGAASCTVRFSRLGNYYHIHNLAYLRSRS